MNPTAAEPHDDAGASQPVALDYDIQGPPDAPVLVLAGSLGTDRNMWRPVLPALTQRLRVLRFDHRGHGHSPTPPGPYTIADLGHDVLALLDRLGLGRVHYAGLSLGGMVGMWLAAHAPRRVDRLVLLCTAAHLPPAQGWLDRAARVRVEGTGSVAVAVVSRWFTDQAPLGLADRYAAMLAGTSADGYAGCCVAIAGMDLRPMLPTITAPTLVIAGAEDPATPPAYGQEIVDGIAGSRLEIVPGVAHLASVERPEIVARLIADHLIVDHLAVDHLDPGHRGG